MQEGWHFMKKRTILDDVEVRIKKYDKSPDASKYNSCYRSLLRTHQKQSLFTENGKVNSEFLSKIVKTLKCFKMHRQMGDDFSTRLVEKLESKKFSSFYKTFESQKIESGEWKNFKEDIRSVYNEFSDGKTGLSQGNKRFDVGTTKLLNFIFPKLFVMLDRNVANALSSNDLVKIPTKGSTYDFSFKSFWKTMRICNKEINILKEERDSVKNILELGEKPTTLPRIFDKCAFIVGKENS